MIPSGGEKQRRKQHQKYANDCNCVTKLILDFQIGVAEAGQFHSFSVPHHCSFAQKDER